MRKFNHKETKLKSEVHIDEIDFLEQISSIHCDFQLGMEDRVGHTTQRCGERYLETQTKTDKYFQNNQWYMGTVRLFEVEVILAYFQVYGYYKYNKQNSFPHR